MTYYNKYDNNDTYNLLSLYLMLFKLCFNSTKLSHLPESIFTQDYICMTD